MGWFKNIVNNVVDAVSDTASNVGQAVGGVVQDAAPYIGALIPGVGLTALAAEKTGLNNGGGLVGGMSDGFQTAAPYYGAAAAGALGQYYMAPALFGTAATAGAPATAGLLSTGGGGLMGAMGAGSVSSVAVNSAGNVINGNPMFRGIGTAALAGAASGGVASAFTPAASGGLQSLGLGERAANTAAGALTAGGTNAGVQYATTGRVNPVGVATSGFMGGVGGYRMPIQTELPGSAGYDPMYSDENFAPSTDDYEGAQFRTFSDISDAEIAASFNATKNAVPYDQILNRGTSALMAIGGLGAAATAHPFTLSDNSVPSFDKLSSPEAKASPLGSESQSLFEWQRQDPLAGVDAATSYLKGYRNDGFTLPQSMAKQTGLMAPATQAVQAMPQEQPAEKEKPSPEEGVAQNDYLQNYIKSNRDNLTKGNWQAYA